MARLSDSDTRALLEFVHDAALEQGPDPFPRPILRRLEEIVAVDGCVLYFELDLIRASSLRSACRSAFTDRDVEFPPNLLEAVMRFGAEFPLASCLGHSDVVLRLSDVISRRELRRLAFYTEVMRPFGDKHYLRAWLKTPRGLSACFEFSRREHPDFTLRDRNVLEVLLPHLTLLRERAAVRSRPTRAGLALTRRETEVMHWVSTGRTNTEIAGVLFVTPGTVRAHLENIYEKLGVHTRTAAVARVFNGSSIAGGGPNPATLRGSSD